MSTDTRSSHPQCARCPIPAAERICQNENGKGPSFCPTLNRDDVVHEALAELAKPDIFEFARQASVQEGAGYGNKELGYERVRPIKTRIEETVEFARRMAYTRLGLAFCLGLRNEARIVERLFADHGFEVVSVLCKLGRTPKERLGIQEDEKIRVGCFESMCNPIAQAKVLNHADTQFNVMLGLCVGHDSLFLKYASAPCTVLAAKDRLLAHNPLAAVYTLGSYYRALK